MESLIHAFGIDVKLIVVQILNFTVMVGILTYLLYKPVLKMLSEREQKIKQGLDDAEAAKEAKEKAEDERKDIVSVAHKEAEEVVVRARESAKEQAEEIEQTASKKASATIKAAEERGESLRQQLIKDSEAEVAKMAILATEKMLKEKTN